ncbi:MAG: hypothetical protein J6A04_01130 [Clostridia bacterium]|nr:hypothetical protein [Clostridia bacterium]
MNHFKKELRQITTKRIDERICSSIIDELKELEEKAEIEEYKTQIQQRSKGIQQIFVNFDHDMEIIDRVNRFRVIPSVPLTFDRVVCLDRIIGKRISEKLESMYQIAQSENFENKEDKLKELSQILDRQLRVNNLLQQYDENMEILSRHRQSYAPNKELIQGK